MKKIYSLTVLPLVLAACATPAPPPPPPPPVVIAPVQTCTPVSALEKVIIPAKTETFIAITEIENPPYEPIVRKEEQVREIEPARTIYVNSQGREVLDICEFPDGVPQ